MTEIEKQLKRVQDKLQQLLKQQQLLQKEKDALKKELDNYKELSAARQSTIDELRQQASILKMNSVEMNDADKKEFEKRLNFYIKEIERCIGLLSN